MIFLPYPTQKLSGCFTLNKYLLGCTLPELERRLGFRTGRLAAGAWIYRAAELPAVDGFNLFGYTQIPADRFETGGRYEVDKLRKTFGDLDLYKLKNMARNTWAPSGPNSLVKVVPKTPHSDSETYPSGSGVPQWKIVSPVYCHLLATLEDAGQRYSIL